jgi:hypothetical protein
MYYLVYVFYYLIRSSAKLRVPSMQKKKREKNANLVYEVAADVQFGYELTNHEFMITKLTHTSVLVTT